MSTPPPAKKRGVTLSYEAEAAAIELARAAVPKRGPTLEFDSAASLPAANDNVAIAIHAMEAGTLLRRGADLPELQLAHSVLEGHRVAILPIRAGELITSWGEPFGRALLPISPGEWIRNIKTLKELQRRQEPQAMRCNYPNFEDYIKPCELTMDTFVAGEPVPLSRPDETFAGFRRPGARGVGTRNYGVVMCVSSRSNAFARALERRLRASPVYAARDGFDGVVAMPHTEDGGALSVDERGPAHNQDKLVRTLLGLMMHPNVGAVLVLQTADDVSAAARGEGVDFAALRRAAEGGRRGDLASLAPQVLTLQLADFEAELAEAEAAVAPWPDSLASSERVSCSCAHLAVAQQCGGSDAFSGTNSNPLLAAACKLLIESGGAALLAETDELIGAEQYVLQRVRDYETAAKFLEFVQRFRGYTAAHGASAEGNPSGGNVYRGLYNIALKSLGAAMKRHPG